MTLPDIPLVVLDTETTGLLPRVNRVIEYAHVIVREGKIAEEYETLVSVPDQIPDIVRILTRIEQKDLEGKPAFADIRGELLSRIGEDTLIVGQNVGFDIRMLKGEGLDLSERPWIDTSMLASLVFPEFDSYSLGYVSTVLKLDHTPVHRALGDVRATLQLLERCMERITELPPELREELIETFRKSTPGYRMLADALPASTAKKNPRWLTVPEPPRPAPAKDSIVLKKPAAGTPDLVEEPLDPSFLQRIINGAVTDADTVHWIAVKNITATVRQLTLPDGVRVLQPPFLLLDPEAVDSLQQQETLTADEATLLLKLSWYDGVTQDSLPVHGDEKSVWSGKLACTAESKTYLKQFTHLPSVILIDHRQLLSILADPEHEAHGALTENAHVIVDDASMLEDTATKAYGHYLDLQELRAAAEGSAGLTKLADALQIWIEKVRNTQDVRYLTPHDLSAPEAGALLERIAEMQQEDQTPQIKRMLTAAEHCLERAAADRISWIETRQDGAQFLQSVPPSVALLLKEHLYSRFPTTLLIPQKSAAMLPEIVPPGFPVKVNGDVVPAQRALPVSFPADRSARDVLCDPPDGKSIVLVGSKRIIEQFFTEFTADLEDRGVTLICQGMSGGTSRMRAEFLAAEAPVVWVLTPWMFETVDLPEGSVDYLALDALPFDHPRHAVIGRRAERFRDAFSEYSLPRLLHRLFRIMRTFRSMCAADATAEVLDKRIGEKRYGKTVQAYVGLICAGTGEPGKKGKTPNSDYPENWQMNLF